MNKLLQILHEFGEDNDADYNDELEGYFGWRLFYQNGSLCLQVTLEEHPPEEDVDDTGSDDLGEPDLITTEQTWVLTPQS